MINKKSFIFDTLADALKYRISADARNSSYRFGSFAPDAPITEGEPDIPYYSEILIRETNQIWRCNQFWLNDVERSPDNDLTTERAERTAADSYLQEQVDGILDRTATIETDLSQEIAERRESDENLAETLENQQAALAALGLRIDALGNNDLITMDEFRTINPKKFQMYYVARDESEKKKLKCWRIYLRAQLVGEFASNGKLTLPVFPMRFPFRFA